jgi:FlaA1/EpsC-like NDP-sugar epimerase
MIRTLQQRAPELCRRLVGLPRGAKRAILVVLDFLLLTAVMVGVVWLRRLGFEELTELGLALMLLAPIATVATFAWLGLYRMVTRYIGHRGTWRIAGGVALGTLIFAMLVLMAGQQGIPRSSIPLYGLLGTFAIVASRHLAVLLLQTAGIPIPPVTAEARTRNVLIYGAGEPGVRLLQAIRSSNGITPVGFVDAERSLWGQYVAGLKVYRPEKLIPLIEGRGIDEVLLALPSDRRQDRRAVLDQLRGQSVAVKVLPGLEDIASGRVSVSDLKPIDVDDLLGREQVPPDTALLQRSIGGKAILVTGAGGSIGSELVRQILKQRPARLVLLDAAEFALYAIEMETREIVAAMSDDGQRPVVVAVLGSVLDEAVMAEVLARNRIDTVFHAAAYKHVPIVEANPVIGIENNTFGTLVAARAAAAAGVERFVLISTDKAVRPTNVMGASKRLAELILQALAAEPGCKTVFSMVRFGNVLDSSGSVVALFRKQIRAGGPVTVTHPDITRYFMSIPEAATLVIQAGAMADGGEVFVLEMGDPVRIDDLARLMIRLTGLEVRSPDRADGDIAISYTGLRPGEKLYEELLIGEHTAPTEHPRILRSGEPFLQMRDLLNELGRLEGALRARDVPAIEAVLTRLVEGYRPGPPAQRTPSLHVTAAPSRTLH